MLLEYPRVVLEVVLRRCIADFGVHARIDECQVADAVNVLVPGLTLILQVLPRKDVVNGRIFADDVLDRLSKCGGCCQR